MVPTAKTWDKIGSDIVGEEVSARDGGYSGWSVSLSNDGDIVAIGAPKNNGTDTNSGHVRVYNWDGSNWVQRGTDIDGEAGYDKSGESMSLSSDGNTVAIGAINNSNDNGSWVGHVRAYRWDGSDWVQLGTDIDGDAGFDYFGYSVSLADDGNTLAISAYRNANNSGMNSGYVRVYDWNGSQWVQLGPDFDVPGSASCWQCKGFSVSLSADGSTLAIGTTWAADENGDFTGNVRVYNWNESDWIQIGSDIDGEAANDNSGFSVSLSNDGNTVAIGATKNQDAAFNAGHVRVYRWNGSEWVQIGSDIDGEAANDSFGHSVSLSGDGSTVAIGGYQPYGPNGVVRIFS